MLKKISLLIIIAFCSIHQSIGQQNDNSPYSRYGIGNLADNNFNHLRQMGGLGASYIDAYHINIVNPASYAFLNAAAFDAGIFAKRTWLEDAKSTNKIWSGNLEYLSLAFPLRNPINEIYDNVKRNYRLGMAFSLMQHSNVNYDVASIDSLSDGTNFSRNYKGTGGTYKVLWGNAIKYKDFSLGVNLGYLFGRMKYTNELKFSPVKFAYSDYYGNDYSMRGFLWNAGFLYATVVNKKAIERNKTTPIKRISIGVHGQSTTSFSTDYSINHILLQQLPGNLFNEDTLLLVDSVPGKGKLPAEFGFGVTYYSGE